MMRIKRFNVLERLFHLFLIVTFLIQSTTGFGRLFFSLPLGERLCNVFGGYETALIFHIWVGIVMIVGFVIHTGYVLLRVQWRRFPRRLFGPDSLIPNLDDARNVWQQIRHFFGRRSRPQFDRWTYWEKFDYWAVYWGMPLLAITGLMTAYPLFTSRLLPGWCLNIAAFVHRAEAVLAASYIFIVHFFIGHLRPANFPMNEIMFSGNITLEEARKEKPKWVARLNKEGKLSTAISKPPKPLFRIAYFTFGYLALLCGVYLLINGIIYSQFVSLH